MKHLKRSFAVLMLLTLITPSRTFAQDFEFDLQAMLMPVAHPRAMQVMQNNEYTSTGYEKGNFYNNPLLLNGKPLLYAEFTLESKGELTVIKGAPVTGKTVQVPFYAYLRRNGIKVFIPGCAPKQTKIEISNILRHAKTGDQLVIEAVRKEDGAVKRILKVPGGGC